MYFNNSNHSDLYKSDVGAEGLEGMLMPWEHTGFVVLVIWSGLPPVSLSQASFSCSCFYQILGVKPLRHGGYRLPVRKIIGCGWKGYMETSSRESQQIVARW